MKNRMNAKAKREEKWHINHWVLFSIKDAVSGKQKYSKLKSKIMNELQRLTSISVETAGAI